MAGTGEVGRVEIAEIERDVGARIRHHRPLAVGSDQHDAGPGGTVPIDL